MKIEIRRVEPGDYKAVQQVHAQPNALRGTLQLPFPSEESWKERIAKFGANDYALVACVEGEIVGMLSLMATTPSPRRKHVGWLGMAVHDKWQSKGVGTALMKAAIDLADKWLDLSRLNLPSIPTTKRHCSSTRSSASSSKARTRNTPSATAATSTPTRWRACAEVQTR